MTAHNDLAYGALLDTFTPEQILAGECEIVTNQGVVAVAAIAKYQIAAVAADGTVHPFVPGTDTIDRAVIAAQAAVVGAHLPYFQKIYANASLVTVSAGDASLNTPAKLKAAFQGNSGIRFGIISPGA